MEIYLSQPVYPERRPDLGIASISKIIEAAGLSTGLPLDFEQGSRAYDKNGHGWSMRGYHPEIGDNGRESVIFSQLHKDETRRYEVRFVPFGGGQERETEAIKKVLVVYPRERKLIVE